jgi:hypothetical protein
VFTIISFGLQPFATHAAKYAPHSVDKNSVITVTLQAAEDPKQPGPHGGGGGGSLGPGDSLIDSRHDLELDKKKEESPHGGGGKK